MKDDRIVSSANQYGSYTKPSTEFDKYKKRSYGSNRGLYLPISKSITESDVAPASSESQDSMDAERGYLSTGTYGVDKTRIAVSIDSDSIHLPTFMARLLKPKRDGTPSDGIAQIADFPDIYIKWDHQRFRLYMEFNPSDFTRNTGLELCPFDLLPAITELVIRRVLLHGDPAALPLGAAKARKKGERYSLPEDWAKDIEVFRIDLARDFHITDERFSLRQLEATWPSRSRNRAATHFLNGGKLNTLSYPVSNRTTKIKLYDKYEERQAKPINDAPPIPVGTFRFEISIPRHQLRLVHLTNLEVLTPKRLEKLLKEKWEVSNYWTNLIWEGEAMDLAHESTLTTARINEVIGFAECLRNSIFMRYSIKEERALKADAKRLGVSLGRAITKQGKPYAHLHFMSGDLSAPIPDTYNLTKGGLFSIIGSKPIPKLI
jgi:hypothetical protein